MEKPLQAPGSEWIETFRCRSRVDLHPGWWRRGDQERRPALADPWGRHHRPDWAERGLLIWPRGGNWLHLEQTLVCPKPWMQASASCERLVLSWWADAVRLRVDGVLVHEGDLFDTRCRWLLPEDWRDRAGLRIQLELRSPCHDDGALIHSALVQEPLSAHCDSDRALLPEALELSWARGESLSEAVLSCDPLASEAIALVDRHLEACPKPLGAVHWLGHAHLDLAWLWPVADTWQAAERTFCSALDLMERYPELHFAHSTPALYAWVERHRPALHARIQQASREGRWEPINGPWVETDCVLVSTASLSRQFSLGQEDSQRRFPEWRHDLAWLPDSFGFAAGLPAVAVASGVRWFCTHKLAWNATNRFPHRLFRWRSRGGAEVLALMLPGIGTDGDPVAMAKEQRDFQSATGVAQAIWLPGVGDHGGGPTAEMLEQLRLWEGQPQAVTLQPGTLRAYLDQLESWCSTLPVWRDELYLELHRGCATSRPDQKRHNRSLERLLRETELAAALLGPRAKALVPSHEQASDWRPLLFQQFHDILPGTSIPEVFEQAEPIWCDARRRAARGRDQLLGHLLSSQQDGLASDPHLSHWTWCGLQPLAHWSPLLRLPQGHWSSGGQLLPEQAAPSGGVWVQLPCCEGVCALPLQRSHEPLGSTLPVRHPVSVEVLSSGEWRLGNGVVSADVSAHGLVQLRDGNGLPQLSEPMRLLRFSDRGEFWDAWDLAADYRQHPLPMAASWSAELVESGPLAARIVLRTVAGLSKVRLDLLLQADSPWIEAQLSVHWQQTHELLRLELPLMSPAVRWAADTSGGVIERPAQAFTPFEQERWEVPVISWLAAEAEAPGGGLAVLLDGPQGVDASAKHLGVSLLRGPTWPDPSADHGWHRHRLAFMPALLGWNRSGVAHAAIRFREPGWMGPVALEQRWQGLPALPVGLVPISIRSAQGDGFSDKAVQIELLNPGPARQRWWPGSDWRLSCAKFGDRKTFWEVQPGELITLVLENVQSS